VLPFQNMSGDPKQEYFVDGMVEEIITALGLDARVCGFAH
jgi:adenylate cyclase